MKNEIGNRGFRNRNEILTYLINSKEDFNFVKKQVDTPRKEVKTIEEKEFSERKSKVNFNTSQFYEEIPKSKYSEDEFEFGHSSVFGSYYDHINGKWGYDCCKSTIRNSNCFMFHE
jgi:hypothetical protein